MTTPRVWLYEGLTSAGLASFLGGANPRVFAKKTMTSNQEDHPFAVYKLGFSANEDIAEVMPDGRDVYRQFVQIWVHDYHDTDTGDYMLIDEILKLIKQTFHGQSSAAHGVISCKYIETSQDLNDETLNTLVKYARLQLEVKET